MVGLGFDLHRLGKGKGLILGGINIPYPMRLLGHSDGDVVLHAICDAILGATGMGDIGDHFPDSKPQYKGVSSTLLLLKVLKMIRLKGYRIQNIDINIILQRPKLGGWKAEIRKNISRLTGLGTGRVNVKAKTTEGLGHIGKGKAVAAQAIVSVR
jgi:2-C-methyl-D-erythritol 2,4-cyclodiphosphate synthase